MQNVKQNNPGSALHDRSIRIIALILFILFTLMGIVTANRKEARMQNHGVVFSDSWNISYNGKMSTRETWMTIIFQIP